MDQKGNVTDRPRPLAIRLVMPTSRPLANPAAIPRDHRVGDDCAMQCIGAEHLVDRLPRLCIFSHPRRSSREERRPVRRFKAAASGED
jgi:hypothetical protein